MFDETTPLRRLLKHVPDAARTVLGWYGLPIGAEYANTPLVDICEAHGVDVDDVLVDLLAQVDDD